MPRKLLFAYIIAIAMFGCQNQTSTPVQTETKDRLAEKHVPSDEFFLQRTFPDGRFSIDAFEKGLKQAKISANSRSVTSGFNDSWTVQGPGNIGARTNTIAIDPNDESIMYAGFAGGGVYKTIDNGENWTPIFDDQTFLNIGDITIDPNNSNIVYVGTGDPNISGYPKIGDGLYKSSDGGLTWENIGLSETRIISKVILHPTNDQTIFVSTMGIPFLRNNDRGLYRTENGGQDWDQILFISDSTGISDLVMHPSNPDILYATGWDRIRNNAESLIRGVGAKVYRSIDGGDNWEMLEGGLPNDVPHSRTGITISKSNPNVLYVEYVGTNLQLEDIYRTNDGGDNWFPIPTDQYENFLDAGALGGFGWYFGKIRVNPNDENDLFLLGVDLWRTKDAGLTWDLATPPWWEYTVHADKHDLHFTDSGKLILSTDGGVYRADIDGENWEDIENIPTTQFYRVAYNPHNPNWYYGGAQDNGSTGGNAENINSWQRIYGGDGFQMAFDTENEYRYFTETQNGNINVTISGGANYESGDDGIDFNDRRNWDMPYLISPHDNNVLFAGTYRMYLGNGQVPQWSSFSEDLSNAGAIPSRYQNITALDESKIEQFLVYAGTGDGNVWRAKNLTDWTKISDNLPVQYVTDVVASPSDVNSVFVTYSGYRDNDFTPRIFRSNDQGENWEDISSDLPDLAINELLILPEQADSVLFVATDGGVYGTINAGETWERLGNNMPTIQVYDLVLNEAKNELVAGTFARSIMSYTLDSLLTVPDSTVSSTTPNFEFSKTIKVYPTIANSIVNIELENIEPNRNLEMVILNDSGKLIHSDSFDGRSKKIELDISDWNSGHYFIKVKMRHQILTERFLVVK